MTDTPPSTPAHAAPLMPPRHRATPTLEPWDIIEQFDGAPEPVKLFVDLSDASAAIKILEKLVDAKEEIAAGKIIRPDLHRKMVETKDAAMAAVLNDRIDKIDAQAVEIQARIDQIEKEYEDKLAESDIMEFWIGSIPASQFDWIVSEYPATDEENQQVLAERQKTEPATTLEDVERDTPYSFNKIPVPWVTRACYKVVWPDNRVSEGDSITEDRIQQIYDTYGEVTFTALYAKANEMQARNTIVVEGILKG